MAIGVILIIWGYVTFYWGYGHFGHQCRYSYWCLLGLKENTLTGQTPFTFGQGQAAGGTTKPVKTKCEQHFLWGWSTVPCWMCTNLLPGGGCRESQS